MSFSKSVQMFSNENHFLVYLLLFHYFYFLMGEFRLDTLDENALIYISYTITYSIYLVINLEMFILVQLIRDWVRKLDRIHVFSIFIIQDGNYLNFL